MREERVTGFFDESLETMTAEERRDSLNRKLKDIVGYAYTHAAAFREKMDTSGLAPLDIQTVEDLEKLPIIRREDLVEAQTKIPPFGGFEAVSTGEMRRIYVSPGPVYEPGPWDYKDIGWAQALFAAGFRKNDIVQNTFNYHMWPFAFILDDSLKMIGCSVIPTGAGNSLIQLTIMKKLRTTGIVGTPSFLMSLAQRAESQGMTIKKDFSPISGIIIMPVGDKYLVDLDASSSLKEGDILTLVMPGEKIIHPVTQKLIGTLDVVKGYLRVSQIKSGYSYATLITEGITPEKGLGRFRGRAD
jgi:phenylacetate-coenzyme A ligase PaaK-like adenylate-forming protein